jgi:hypothetical protein
LGLSPATFEFESASGLKPMDERVMPVLMGDKGMGRARAAVG